VDINIFIRHWKLTPWYSVANDGTPIRNGVYETYPGCFQRFMNGSWGKSYNTPGLAICALFFFEEFEPLFWRGIKNGRG